MTSFQIVIVVKGRRYTYPPVKATKPWTALYRCMVNNKDLQKIEPDDIVAISIAVDKSVAT